MLDEAASVRPLSFCYVGSRLERLYRRTLLRYDPTIEPLKPEPDTLSLLHNPSSHNED